MLNFFLPLSDSLDQAKSPSLVKFSLNVLSHQEKTSPEFINSNSNFFQLTLVLLLFTSSKLWARLNTLLEKPPKWKTTWRQLSELWPIPNLTGSLDTGKNEHRQKTGLGEEVLCWEMYHWRTIQGDLKCWRTSILTSKEEQRSELPAGQELESHLL